MDRIIGGMGIFEIRKNIEASERYISDISPVKEDTELQTSKILQLGDGNISCFNVGAKDIEQNSDEIIGAIKALIYVAQGLISEYGKDINSWQEWWGIDRKWIDKHGNKNDKSCFQIALEGGIGDVAIFQNRTMG